MKKINIIFITICLFNLIKVYSQKIDNIEKIQIKLNKVLIEREFVFDSLKGKKEIDLGFFTKKSERKSQLKEYKKMSNNSSIYLITHVFDNNKQVSTLYNDLKLAKDTSLYIGKEFYLILFVENIIYEIYAPCSFSSKVWKDLVKGIEKLDKLYNNRIACICGGACNFE